MGKIKTVMAAFCSPCGATEKVTVEVAAGIAESLGANLRTFNWTVEKNREWRLEFGPAELLVVGTPTYAGRVPNKLMPYIKDNLLAEGAGEQGAPEIAAAEAAPVFAVPVVTYGGRAFDNSLAEEAGLLKKNGFTIAGGAAFPSEHVFTDLLQPGRPNADDLAHARAFGAAVGEKLLATDVAPAAWHEPVVPGDYAPAAYYQPVNLAGQPTNFLKAKPVLAEDRCAGCGSCAEVCPMASITMESRPPKAPVASGAEVQVPAFPGICIKCQACVKACPKQALTFKDEAFLGHVEMLARTFAENVCEPLFVL